MNKKLISICALFVIGILNSYSQDIEFARFELRENLPDWISPQLDDLKIGKKLSVDGGLNPFYLEADFNGDKFLDIALFVSEKESNKKGILIIHGKTLTLNLIGAGNKFGKVDDFNWMKVWKVFREETAFRTIFKENFDIEGSEEVKLKNIAISVAPSEGTYNLIVWNGEKYEWIHTGD